MWDRIVWDVNCVLDIYNGDWWMCHFKRRDQIVIERTVGTKKARPKWASIQVIKND